MDNTIPSAWKGHKDFALWVCQKIRPNVVVDLGVDFGYSTFCFGRGCKMANTGVVVGIDTFEGDEHCGARNTLSNVRIKRTEMGLNNIILLRGWFDEIRSHWVEPIDILHIDGRHKYEDIKRDYESWAPFVRPNGVILMHDTNVGPESYSFGVRRYFDEIKLPKCTFLQSFGLGVVCESSIFIDQVKENWDLETGQLKF